MFEPPALAAYLARLEWWRGLSAAEKAAATEAIPFEPGPSPAIDPAARDAVNACPSRGPVLPVSALSGECCGGGPERWECSAGKGSTPGRPTLRDCLACGGL